jgi:O-ureido-D-serine cyclo-ligase
VTFWDDPAVAWEHFDVVVSVYAWGYVTERVAFLSWADRVAAVSHLVNPAPVLRWNSDKIYLADLAGEGPVSAGIHRVGTMWSSRRSAPGAGVQPATGRFPSNGPPAMWTGSTGRARR